MPILEILLKERKNNEIVFMIYMHDLNGIALHHSHAEGGSGGGSSPPCMEVLLAPW